MCVCGRLTMMEKKQHLSVLTLVLEGGTQLEIERLKGYGTIKSLGTTSLYESELPLNVLSCLFLPSGECVRCMFWNNLGCIHFAMGKHNLGIFYFKKALQENDHTCAQLGDGGATGNGQCESTNWV